MVNRRYYADEFVLPLPRGIAFPWPSTACCVTGLPRSCRNPLHVAPQRQKDEELARVHLPEYIAAIAQGSLGPAAQREIGFP